MALKSTIWHSWKGVGHHLLTTLVTLFNISRFHIHEWGPLLCKRMSPWLRGRWCLYYHYSSFFEISCDSSYKLSMYISLFSSYCFVVIQRYTLPWRITIPKDFFTSITVVRLITPSTIHKTIRKFVAFYRKKKTDFLYIIHAYGAWLFLEQIGYNMTMCGFQKKNMLNFNFWRI